VKLTTGTLGGQDRRRQMQGCDRLLVEDRCICHIRSAANPLLCCPHDAQVDVSAARHSTSSSSALYRTKAHVTHNALYNFTARVRSVAGHLSMTHSLRCWRSRSLFQHYSAPTSCCAALSKPGGAGSCFAVAPASLNSSRHFLKSAMTSWRLSINCNNVASQGLRLVEAHWQVTTWSLQAPATLDRTPGECWCYRSSCLVCHVTVSQSSC
jgi:hypothetical protein